MTRVAVIGAGPCGLAQLHSFAEAARGGADVPEVVCFEKQSDWGGLWNYTWRTGTDQHGDPVHGSMYRYLWSNGPKECLEFADYSFDDHFGRGIGSFPPREVLYDYIVGRATRSGIRDQIRFNHAVQSVTWDDSSETFTVTVRDRESDTTSSETFTHVVVATGHFSTPNLPHYPGFERFGGQILHAHDFRDAAHFKDRTVVVIGSSYSAEDVASQLWKYGAAEVICSSRSGPMGFDWPDGIREVPILTHVEGRTVHFSDGTSTEADAIIACTGYKHHFPFMADDLTLHTGNVLALEMLFRGVVFQPNNRVSYLGMQDQWYTFNMFDVQAWYARDVIMGRIELPSAAEQQTWIDAARAAEAQVEDDYGLIDFQGDYTRDLLGRTDYPSFDTELIDREFKSWKKHKKESIIGYRNHAHTSPVTGSVSPLHHTDWADALDDSLTSFLDDDVSISLDNEVTAE